MPKYNTPEAFEQNPPQTAAKTGQSTRPILYDTPLTESNGKTNKANQHWIHIPFQVKFGQTFTTLADSLKYMTTVYGNDGTSHYNPLLQEDAMIKKETHSTAGDISRLADATGIIKQANFLGRSYFKDTRVGANDAINCIWQFNRDDDIVHETHISQPIHTTYDSQGRAKSTISGYGMGRVYAETTEQDQQVMWLTFGVARFTKVIDFYMKAFKADLIRTNQLGITKGNKQLQDLGYLFGSALGALAFALPAAPLRWLINIISINRNMPINRFYDFRPTMHLYYRYVDSILSEWLVSTGIYGTKNDSDKGGITDIAKTWKIWGAEPSSLPIALQETGVGIWNILKRKAMNLMSHAARTNQNLATSALISDDLTAQAFEKEVNDIMSKYTIDPDGGKDTYDGDSNNIWGGDGVDWEKYFLASALGATQFLGFRIEKSTDSSESFSNSTGPSQFAEMVNNQVREAMGKAYDMGLTEGGGTGIGFMDGLINQAKSAFSSLAGSTGLDGLSTAMLSTAFIDIPEQYKSSTWGTSHSVTFQLRAPAGDITSIYQSIIVPLACILAGALPRAAGTNSYVQPFLCRVYCKGMFSIPLGIIESLSIKRGSSEFGWTYQNLPTAIDVSLTFKDMSPIMYMTLNASTLQDILGNNSAFHEYMLTLAGTGLFERVSRLSSWRRTAQLAMHKLRNMYTNSMYWSNAIGDSSLVQFVAGFTPWTEISSR